MCIFAYGQTGSGKTHTMSGTNTEDVRGRGINYRALDDLFGIRDSRPEVSAQRRLHARGACGGALTAGVLGSMRRHLRTAT